MPLFRRKNKKASQVRMGNMGAMVPLVQTPNGIQPLQRTLDQFWEDIAATAWDGYERVGRGLIWFDPETGNLDYVSLDRIRELSRPEAPLGQCQKYDPGTQVVVATEIVHARGLRRDPQDFGVILTMPDGGLSPLAAYESPDDGQ
jgi:hypothetical protein